MKPNPASLSNGVDSKTELLLHVLAGGASSATCEKCGATEWVIPLDQPFDEIFLANYRCDECEELATSNV